MCGAHRSDVIQHIRTRLQQKRESVDHEPLRVVSTSLIEAGVDVDFPVVYRAMAGLDSIAQAAGRCNREGRLPGLGQVIVFVPPRLAPPGLQRMGADSCRSILGSPSGDPLRPELFTRYFNSLYSKPNLDQHGIVERLKNPRNMQLREVADRFKLIEDEQQAILVPYQSDPADTRYTDAHQLLMTLPAKGPALRKLQRFTVTVSRRDFQQLQRRNEIREPFPAVFELVSPAQYDLVSGLLLQGPDAGTLLMV
jgi:CRISPR-associated endonuclease/helicase Cas3